jgi:ABC-type branched-subunit amino acid transport system ATPase component
MLRVEAIDVAYGHAQVLHQISLAPRHGRDGFRGRAQWCRQDDAAENHRGIPLAPVSGTINLDGAQVQGIAEGWRDRACASVNQDKKVFADLTVKDNMELRVCFAANRCTARWRDW